MRYLLLLILFLSLPALAQDDPEDEGNPQVDYSVVLQTFADVPVTFDVGSSNLFGPHLGGTVGVSFYPLPLILEGEGNIDLAADLIYRRGRGPLKFIASAGPRYRIIASDWLSEQASVGAYLGAGASAGLEFDANFFGQDVLDAFSKVSVDYTRGVSGNASDDLIKLRLGVGLRLPMLRLSASF